MRGAASSVGLIDNIGRRWHIANVNAELLRRQKSVLSDGAILEMVIWRVPNPVAGSAHSYKYRLYYGH
jgi:hypothetical protein